MQGPAVDPVLTVCTCRISQSAELDDVLDATNPYFSIQAAQKKVVNGSSEQAD